MFPKMLRLLEAGNSLEGGAGRNSPEGGTCVGGRREPGGTRRQAELRHRAAGRVSWPPGEGTTSAAG